MFEGTFTPEQAEMISDQISSLSITDQEYLLNSYDCTLPDGVYTNLSMRNGEMGGFSRY